MPDLQSRGYLEECNKISEVGAHFFHAIPLCNFRSCLPILFLSHGEYNKGHFPAHKHPSPLFQAQRKRNLFFYILYFHHENTSCKILDHPVTELLCVGMIISYNTVTFPFAFVIYILVSACHRYVDASQSGLEWTRAMELLFIKRS